MRAHMEKWGLCLEDPSFGASWRGDAPHTAGEAAPSALGPGGVCQRSTRPGADGSRSRGRTATVPIKLHPQNPFTGPCFIHSLNQTPEEASGKRPGCEDEHSQGDLHPADPSLRSLSWTGGR